MSDEGHQPLGIVPSSAPRNETRLPRLPGEVDINMDLPDVHFPEAQRRGGRVRKSTPGGTDLAAMSRKRRDVALAGRENVLDVGPVGITLPAPRALPGTLLKSSTRTVRARASPVEAPSFAVPEMLGAGAGHRASLEPESKTELQKLQEELRLQSSDLNRCRSALKKKSEEYEGCMALLNVTQAELRLCQERIRTQSPTPPVNPPRRLQGINVFGSERELAEEAAAFAVSSLLSRVQLRMKAAEEQAKEQEELEKQRERRKQAKKGRQSPTPPSGSPSTGADLPRTLENAGNAVRTSPAAEPSRQPMPGHSSTAEATRPGPPHTGSLGPAGTSPPPHTGSPETVPMMEAQTDPSQMSEASSSGPAEHTKPRSARARPTSSLSTGADLPSISEAADAAVRSSPATEPGPGTVLTVEAETDPSQKSKPPAPGPAAHAKPRAAQARPRIAGSPAKTAGTSGGTAVAKGQDADELLQQCLEEQDQDLDDDALRAHRDETEAYTPAQSPPPDTGGTPTPGPYEREEAEEFPEWPNCSIIREQEVSCAATQTSPSVSPTPEASGKAAVTSQEEIRTLKLVVANSKKEILYYNKVLMEKTAEHQQELQELKDTMVQERKRCEEDMKHWKKHVKKELAKDPIMTVALWMWDRELTAMRTRQAFDQWRRKSNQIIKARGISGKIATLVSLHQCLRDWRVGILELRAEKMRAQLQQRWFHSLDQATIAWGRELEHGLKTSALAAWAWQTRYTMWEGRAQMKVRQTLQRWFYSSTQAALHFAFRSWTEALTEVRLQAFRLQMQGKQAAYHKAIMAFAPSMDSLKIRTIFQAWTWVASADKVRGLTRRLHRDTKVEKALMFMASEHEAVTQLCIFRRWVSQVESLKARILTAKLKASGTSGEVISAMTHFANDQPVLMLQWVLLGWHRYIFLQNLRRDEDPSKRQAIAYCISAFTFASRGLAFGMWKKIVQKRRFQRGWVRFFRPTEDLLPLFRSWRLQVARAEACQRTQIRVEKREYQNTFLVTMLCFILWRLKLRPSAAVVSYVPKLARCKEVALRKLGELQVQCSCLVVLRAWQTALQEQRTVTLADEKSKTAQAEVEKLETKNKALQDEMAAAEQKYAKEREEMQQELNKAKKSGCCVVQ